jgi:hypothetical protein
MTRVLANCRGLEAGAAGRLDANPWGLTMRFARS